MVDYLLLIFNRVEKLFLKYTMYDAQKLLLEVDSLDETDPFIYNLYIIHISWNIQEFVYNLVLSYGNSIQ